MDVIIRLICKATLDELKEFDVLLSVYDGPRRNVWKEAAATRRSQFAPSQYK